MQKMLNCLLLVLVISSWLACHNQRFVKEKANLQGVLLEQSYNSMPMSDRPNSKGAPLVTSLLIYAPTNSKQLDSLTGPFCSAIHAPLVTTVHSDESGRFYAKLKPGVYSIFIRYQNAFYIPYFSGSTSVALFEIKQKEPTQLEIIVRDHTNSQ